MFIIGMLHAEVIAWLFVGCWPEERRMISGRSAGRMALIVMAMVSALLAIQCSSDGGGPGPGPESPKPGATGAVRLLLRGVR